MTKRSKPVSTAIYQTTQRALRLTEGLRLVAAIKAGRSPRDLLLSYPGSRASFYRAIKLATVDGDKLPRTQYGCTRRASDDEDFIPDPLLL